MITAIAKKIFGTRNDKEVKRYFKRVALINALEGKYSNLSDDELKAEFDRLKSDLISGKVTKDDILNDVFAIVRETGKRTLNMRHFDVQLVGGMVLNDGKIAEMKTGEGKTLVATLPVVLNAMDGKGVHVVTVNDYLAKRDAEQMSAIYNFLGLSVGVILSGEYDDEKRKESYNSDITYGTNNEFGFDYLRDNMKFEFSQKVQREHNFVIVDEVDSILIDEARTPLIISGPTNRTLDGYIKADEVAKAMTRGEAADPKIPNSKATGDFVVDEKNRTIMITEAGIAKAEKLFGVENLYDLENAILSHHLDQALKAHNLFEKDVHYVVRDNQVVIVDEFTGRLSEGRRFSEGLHQALEAKEGVKIQEESQTLADITFQNYFRMYKKLSGMTGTAQTEATEFSQIYKLDVISIPTNVPIKRVDKDDLIYKTENEKFKAVIEEIKRVNLKGQPVLVGTASIEKSEVFHKMLAKEKIPHSVLNAKNHEKEAEIIAEAGAKGAVTIATNMAGRGVDIRINDEVRSLGGLYIIGTERHESRRIDNQLRGRAGRQGDPGLSRFYLSLEDNLLRIFGSDKIKAIMDRLGIEDGESIESRLVTRAVENAQKKVESLHFESRKHILEYDDVANEQRKTIYRYRNELLNPQYDLKDKIISNREDFVKSLLDQALIYEGGISSEFNIEALINTVYSNSGTMLTSDELSGLDYATLIKTICSKLQKDYEDKMSVIDEEQRKNIEKVLYLQIVDNAWREHLYQMDILKTGIGLRGYNQKDPLTEYKKESYNLFMELVSRLKNESIKTLQIVRFKTEQDEALNNSIEKIKKSEESQISEVPNSKKPARNEPCPCGSGKKYKDCCGKSGPKKGMFA
ncbi:preprotein translocase subunit SecA [Campylobacter hyointestinalis]|uniref:preprotein translocase subunit SecA n=1 Tax=Campylobacter hyointestinalis TaxID=198 RepID=UPI000CE3C8A8|nr:preprotein translocase subunit SecA [Campylobacter hyointestinalis]PPB73694.1 preprotein translocase subunit SecA [Campylobacter hyointestinalis subsp. hyointestinalis]PPB75295.1 preprotein translocase subunit SecA [Campylobacter hyointestinalis subsp. hyointestinalis]PPB76955.1 preprotein translocase subunit SecA [Campylobacter hyointestinalis subsp. hyointestinalis]PPB79048.1 preprotein translocase subunit SecA [Campylobacter hyointestinalis subsp. hyointestinalis]